MVKGLIFTLSFLLWPTLTVSVQAVEKASESRLDEVSKRGARVMPFSLEETTHIFTKKEKGGVQLVIVKNKADSGQIRLIREHLSKISKEFRRGDFSGPAEIHGEDMPGLAKLKAAKPGEIRIAYRELQGGAEIEYSSENPNLIEALHAWFDAQLSDHARHAMPGHFPHSMHHKP
jgi:hypothetical protein